MGAGRRPKGKSTSVRNSGRVRGGSKLLRPLGAKLAESCDASDYEGATIVEQKPLFTRTPQQSD